MRSAQDKQLAVNTQTTQRCAHRLGVRHGREDDLGATHFEQFRRHVLCLTINVMVRTQLPGQRLLVAASCDGDSLETHLRGELDAQMTETTQAQDCDHIVGSRAAIAKRVERSDPRAHERARLYGGKLLWE